MSTELLQEQQAQQAQQLAQLAASRGAATLRAALKDGAPCPVCGGFDHPYAREAAYAAQASPADAMLAALRENVAESRQALADTLATPDGPFTALVRDGAVLARASEFVLGCHDGQPDGARSSSAP